MRCITLTQPWATLIAIGAKKIETRGWSTSFRGPLAIHAAAGLGPVGGMKGYAELCTSSPFWEALTGAGYCGPHPRQPPRGAIVAVARLYSIYRITVDGIEGFNPQPPANEIAFGDYSPGRYAWLLTDVRALPEPIPARGALGLWEWTPPAGIQFP
jgi:activating signal cointegrator 1